MNVRTQFLQWEPRTNGNNERKWMGMKASTPPLLRLLSRWHMCQPLSSSRRFQQTHIQFVHEVLRTIQNINRLVTWATASSLICPFQNKKWELFNLIALGLANRLSVDVRRYTCIGTCLRVFAIGFLWSQYWFYRFCTTCSSSYSGVHVHIMW